MSFNLANITAMDLDTGEFDPYYGPYVQIVSGLSLQQALLYSLSEISSLADKVAAQSVLHYRYQAGKWSVAEIWQHLVDTEIIFQYRALRIARGDTTNLAGFDQDEFVQQSRASGRYLEELRQLMLAVRNSSLLLFQMFNDEELKKRGVASGSEISVRALGFLICGHQKHHFKIIRERYC